MEKRTYFPPIIYAIIMFVGAMIYGRNWSLFKYIERLHEEYINEEYLAFDYSDSVYKELLEMRDNLKQEIDCYEK